MKLLDNFKKNFVANILACVTIVLLILSMSFYAQATLKNFSAVTIILAVIAIVLFLASMFFNLKGFAVTIATALTAFCFGFFLISRLESLNLLQVNLSDINRFFYVDIVLWVASLVAALATAIVKKIR